jgi:hypothetical protein
VQCLAHLSQLWPHARDPRGFECVPRVVGYHRLHLPYCMQKVETPQQTAPDRLATGQVGGRVRRGAIAGPEMQQRTYIMAKRWLREPTSIRILDGMYSTSAWYDRNDSSRLPRPVNIVGDHLDARDRVSPEGVDVKPATWVTTWLFVCQPGPERMGAQHRCTRVYCTLSPASCRMPIGGRGPMQAGIAAARRVLQNGLL